MPVLGKVEDEGNRAVEALHVGCFADFHGTLSVNVRRAQRRQHQCLFVLYLFVVFAPHLRLHTALHKVDLLRILSDGYIRGVHSKFRRDLLFCTHVVSIFMANSCGIKQNLTEKSICLCFEMGVSNSPLS